MKLGAGSAVIDQSFPAITREQLRAYAGASGDPNPIHLDEGAAQRAGLPGIIAHGMLIMAFLGERAQGWMIQELGAGARISQFQTRFRSMTLVGDVISIGGLVQAVEDDRVRIELQAKNQRQDIVATASITLSR